MTADSINIVIVTYADYRCDIRRVRRQVFINEQGIPESLEWDDFDHCSWHVLAFNNAVAVGTGRLQPDGKITRIAVLKESRNNGIANLLLTGLLEVAEQNGLKNLYLNAQTSAIGLYEKHGFHRAGEVFDEGGIEHIRMQR